MTKSQIAAFGVHTVADGDDDIETIEMAGPSEFAMCIFCTY